MEHFSKVTDLHIRMMIGFSLLAGLHWQSVWAFLISYGSWRLYIAWDFWLDS